jgi:hypothetical protein
MSYWLPFLSLSSVLASAQWSGYPPAPSGALVGASSAASDEHFFVFGGSASLATLALPLRPVNASSAAWSVADDGAALAPQAREFGCGAWVPSDGSGGSACAGVRGTFYVFMGRSGSALLGDVWALPLRASATTAGGWQQVAAAGGGVSSPALRHSAACAARGSSALVVVGGSGAGGDLADAWQFDIASRTWGALGAPGGGPRAGRRRRIIPVSVFR